MKHHSPVLPIAILLAFCILAVPVLILAQSIEPPPNITLDIQGTCREFNVTVSVDTFNYGCYDVKIDVTTPAGRVGQIYDPMQGWKSSIYYVTDGLCLSADVSNETFQIYADTDYEQLFFLCKLRQSSSTWESEYFNVTQDCPAAAGGSIEILILVSSLVILILLIGVTMYFKVLK